MALFSNLSGPNALFLCLNSHLFYLRTYGQRLPFISFTRFTNIKAVRKWNDLGANALDWFAILFVVADMVR